MAKLVNSVQLIGLSEVPEVTPGMDLAQIILDAARATPTFSLNNRTVTGGRLNVSGF